MRALHDPAAEQSVLGALLLDNHAIDIVMEKIGPEDFATPKNLDCFNAIRKIIDRGERADIITTVAELSGKVEPWYLAELTSSVPTAGNIEYYAGIVHEFAILRRLQTLSQRIPELIGETGSRSEDIINEAEKVLFHLGEKAERRDYRTIRDIIPEVIESIEAVHAAKGQITGVPSGFSELDGLTGGFQPAEFWILAARPSVGKTACALSMATSQILRHKLAVGFMSAEMFDRALVKRMICSEGRIDSSRIRSGFLRESDFTSLMDTCGRFYDAKFFIHDTPNMKLSDLLRKARRMRVKDQIDILYIDYLGLLTYDDRKLERYEQISCISRALKQLSRDIEVPVIALSQVGRQAAGRMPTLADIRDSGSIEQDADGVLFLHRKTQEQGQVSETELCIGKQRNGPVGSIKLAYLPSYTRFTEMEKNI